MSNKVAEQRVSRELIAYSWKCECGHLYSVPDNEGSWVSRTAAEKEIERLQRINHRLEEQLVDARVVSDSWLGAYLELRSKS